MDPSLFNNLQEHNFVFHEVVPTLREIASFKVALTLCSDIIHREAFENEKFDLVDDLFMYYNFKIISSKAELLVQEWNLPATIKDSINEWSRTVAERMSNWGCNMHFKFLHTTRLSLSHLECLVWLSSGRIDYEKTGRKMRSHPGFTQVEKFHIMCTFCWRDEIESLIPGVELQHFINDFINDGDNFYERPLTYYWICKLSDELHLIPLHLEFDSIEFFILATHVEHFSSIEYFWDFLNEQDQITMAVKLLDSNFRCMAGIQIPLFAKMNEFQRRSVMAEIPYAIIANFLHRFDFEAARFVWNLLENIITDDQFATLFKNLIKKISSEKSMYFVMELWNTVRDHYKNHFVYTKRDFIVELFFGSGNGKPRDYGLPFLSAILSNVSAEYRRNIILEHGDGLFVKYRNYTVINKIIKFCLPNPGDIAQFKELLRRSDEIASYYYRCVEDDGNFGILVEYLESYVDYQSILKLHIKQALDDVEQFQSNNIYFFHRWSYVRKLLDMIYGTDLSNVIRIKNKLIFSLDGTRHYREDKAPKVEDFRHYMNALQDIIVDKMILAEDSANTM